MRRRGFTLYELMVALVLITIVSGLVASLLATARRDQRAVIEYSDDLRHLRDASNAVSTALRAAGNVQTVENGTAIDGQTWAVRDGVLLRDATVVARGISALVVTAEADGLWRTEVRPIGRRGAEVTASLVTSVRSRVGGER